MTAPLEWKHSIAEIAPADLERARAATPAERAELAATLAILEVACLTARYGIRPLGSGRYRLTGALAANVTQACVVTLDPVPAALEETFEVEFWPSGSFPRPPDGEVGVLSGTDIEAIEGQTIDVGRVVFETLSAGLDPYPRAPDSTFAPPDAGGHGKEPDGPFAALAKFRK